MAWGYFIRSLNFCCCWKIAVYAPFNHNIWTKIHPAIHFVARRVANAQIRDAEGIWTIATGQNTATHCTVRHIIKKYFKPLAVNMLAPMNYDSAIFWKRALWATSLKRWTMHSIFSTHVHHEKKQTAKTKQKQNKNKNKTKTEQKETNLCPRARTTGGVGGRWSARTKTKEVYTVAIICG